jgi:GntR family transcriptional regulator
MFIAVHAGSELPIYRQIMRQVVDAIATGRLAAGDRLPSHRELSEQLVVAPLTVKKAYDELETLGYLESQRGRGTFVSTQRPGTARRAQHAALRDAAHALVAQGTAAGLAVHEIVELVHEAAAELSAEAPKVIP